MKLIRNDVVANLVFGQLVTTDFWLTEADIVRRIESIEVDFGCSSGYRIAADAGEPCACCKRPFGRRVHGIDGSWFSPVKEG